MVLGTARPVNHFQGDRQSLSRSWLWLWCNQEAAAVGNINSGTFSPGGPWHPDADVGCSNACQRKHRERVDLGRHGLGRRDHRRRGRCCGFSLTEPSVGGGGLDLDKDGVNSDKPCLLAGFQVFKISKKLIWIFWGLNLPLFAFFIWVVCAVSFTAKTWTHPLHCTSSVSFKCLKMSLNIGNLIYILCEVPLAQRRAVRVGVVEAFIINLQIYSTMPIELDGRKWDNKTLLYCIRTELYL